MIRKKLSNEQIGEVNGGSMFHTEDRMKELGIELRNEDGTPGEFGYLWNTGDYYYNGEKIDDTDIARLGDFYDMNGR